MKLQQFLWKLSVSLFVLPGSTAGDEHSEHELVAQCVDESDAYVSALVRSQDEGERDMSLTQLFVIVADYHSMPPSYS